MGKLTSAPALTHKAAFPLVVLGHCCPEKPQALNKRWHYRYRDIPYTQGLLLGAQLRLSGARGDHIPHHSKAASSHYCSMYMCWNKQFHTFPLVCQDIKKKNANVIGGNFLKPVEKVGVSNWLSGYLQTVATRVVALKSSSEWLRNQAQHCIGSNILQFISKCVEVEP